jgi:hypothetical protein
MSLDIQNLLGALNDERNAFIDYENIAQIKNDILQNLRLPREELKALHVKLKMYRYVDNINELHYGRHIRWISLKNPESIRLTNGGMVCRMKVHKDNVHVTCKTNFNRLFQINMGEALMFQKLTAQEQVLMSALKLLKNA